MSAYLGGELSSAETAAREAHRAECSECRTYLKSCQETIELEKAAFSEPECSAPDEVPDEVVQAILRARRKAE